MAELRLGSGLPSLGPVFLLESSRRVIVPKRGLPASAEIDRGPGRVEKRQLLGACVSLFVKQKEKKKRYLILRVSVRIKIDDRQEINI